MERGRAFAYNKSTKSETQIGARGFVAVEVVWRLGAWLVFGLFFVGLFHVRCFTKVARHVKQSCIFNKVTKSTGASDVCITPFDE